jgi:hypothetical protein
MWTWPRNFIIHRHGHTFYAIRDSDLSVTHFLHDDSRTCGRRHPLLSVLIVRVHYYDYYDYYLPIGSNEIDSITSSIVTTNDK